MAPENSSVLYHRGILSTTLETWRFRQAARFIPSDAAVLDVACNLGRLSEFLPENSDYTGVDISPAAIHRAKSHYPQRRFIIADLEDPVKEIVQQFNAITMLAFLEHVSSPARVIQDLLPLLKPEGIIIATTPAPISRKIHDVGAAMGLFSRSAADEHHQFLNKEALFQIGIQNGLTIAHFERFMFGLNQLICYRKGIH